MLDNLRIRILFVHHVTPQIEPTVPFETQFTLPLITDQRQKYFPRFGNCSTIDHPAVSQFFQ